MKNAESDISFEYFYLFLLLACFLISIPGAMGVFNNFPVISWFFLLCSSIFSVRVSLFFSPLAIVLIFNLLFLLYQVPAVFMGEDIVSLSLHEGLPYHTQVAWIISLFNFTVSLWLFSVCRSISVGVSFRDLVVKVGIPKSKQIFYSLELALLMAILFGIQGGNVIGGGGYEVYVENLQNTSGLPEYLLVLFFLTGLMADGKLQKLIWGVVLFLFILKTSLIGLRIVSLMGVLCGFWFSVTFISGFRLIFVFIAGFFLFSLLGLLKFPTLPDDLFVSLFFEITDAGLVSHHGNVIWASAVMLKLIDSGVLDFFDRLNILFYYIANSVIPSGVLQNSFGFRYIGVWLQEAGYTSGGGHVAVYAYAASSIVGVIAIASMIGYGARSSVSEANNLSTRIFRVWFMMAMITFPRWISYDMGNFLFRLPIYAAVLFALLVFLSNFGKKNARIND